MVDVVWRSSSIALHTPLKQVSTAFRNILEVRVRDDKKKSKGLAVLF